METLIHIDSQRARATAQPVSNMRAGYVGLILRESASGRLSRVPMLACYKPLVLKQDLLLT